MTNDEYNGYTNYQTWLTELWLDNDRGSYEYMLDLARNAEDCYSLAIQIKELHLEQNPLGDSPSVFSDLLTWSMRLINWNEIAQNYLDVIVEEEE